MSKFSFSCVALLNLHFVAFGCTRTSEVNLIDTGRPFFFVYHNPAYPGPRDPIVAGVVVAIWPDGSVVRIADTDAVGQRYFRGKLAVDELARFIEDARR